MTTALRPMSTGELLDRTFNLYRNNFILFAGIAILPPLLKIALDILQLERLPVSVGRRLAPTAAEIGGSYFLLLLVYLLGLVFSSGATVYAVSMVHLDKSTSITDSYKAIGRYLLRLIGIFLLIVLIIAGIGIAVVGVPAILGGMMHAPVLVIAGVIFGGLVLVHLYVCLSVATAVCVVEKAGVIASLRRSMKLTKGARGRIWLLFLLTLVLNLALGFAIGVPAGIIGVKSGSIFLAAMIIAIAQFFVSTLVTPILAISLVLIYYDQRVRKEAFDLQLMMESLGQSVPDQAIGAAPIG